MMHHIVFLDRATLAAQVRLRRPGFEHVWIEHERTSADQVVQRLQGATMAITNKVPITEDALAQLPQLRLVAVAATGTDCVDLAACARHGVKVCNIRGYAVHTVPEHTLALMLALRRRLLAYRESVLAGRWWDSGQFCFHDHPIADLAGATLGIVGRGELGRRVGELAQAFGMQVLWAGRKGVARVEPPYTPWNEVLQRCDVLSLHCPLTPETRGLLGEAEFHAMRRRPLIINTARGALIDEAALARALDQGLIGGAALDVARVEPPPPDHPLLRLAQRPEVLLTPHVAWASLQAQQRLADQLTEVLEAFAAGRPMNEVGSS
ncbi:MULTISPECIES: NAD(P)-dependent oxidoreductase [Caldimonas]|uniref:NAD(P)-dependent oxidoreductase n=1 Tax=Caldimonas TaxID=196013 RepID=UPI000360EC74|nr:NAD(P)-dependent oxidoreductase [Caldimonas manganoxidans]